MELVVVRGLEVGGGVDNDVSNFGYDLLKWPEL
jgi:hypothetical protein